MPRTCIEFEWDDPDDAFWLNPDNINLALSSYRESVNFIVKDVSLTASEALYGFAGWLDKRGEKSHLSTESIVEFCKANHLSKPRKDWNKKLTYPEKEKK